MQVRFETNALGSVWESKLFKHPTVYGFEHTPPSRHLDPGLYSASHWTSQLHSRVDHSVGATVGINVTTKTHLINGIHMDWRQITGLEAYFIDVDREEMTQEGYREMLCKWRMMSPEPRTGQIPCIVVKGVRIRMLMLNFYVHLRNDLPCNLRR